MRGRSRRIRVWDEKSTGCVEVCFATVYVSVLFGTSGKAIGVRSGVYVRYRSSEKERVMP